MKNIINQIINNIDQELEKLIKACLVQTASGSGRPKWTKANAAVLQNQINNFVGNLIASQLAQAQLPSVNLHPQVLFRALASYTKLRTAEILKKISTNPSSTNDANSKEILNKKIFSAKILLAAFLAAIYQFHERQYRKKLYKKLKKLLAALERNSSSAMAAAGFAYEPSTPRPEPQSIFLADTHSVSAYTHPNQAVIHLRILGLKLGSGHPEIKKAFEKIQEEFFKKTNPTPEEHEKYIAAIEAFQSLMTVKDSELIDLAKINHAEIQELAAHLHGRLDILNHEISIPEIKAALIAAGIKNAASTSPISETQLQNLQLILEKLADKFGNSSKINLQNEFPELQLQRQSSLSQTPRMTLSPRP